MHLLALSGQVCAQALSRTCRQLRATLETAIPRAVWAQIVSRSFPDGHPLRSAAPLSFPQAARELARVHNNIASGRALCVSQLKLFEGDIDGNISNSSSPDSDDDGSSSVRGTYAAAVPSHQGDGLISLRQGAIQMHCLTTDDVSGELTASNLGDTQLPSW